MRLVGLLAVIVAALIAVPAVAQDSPQRNPPPEVLQPDGRIDLGEGDVKVLRFAEPFKTARTPIEGVIEVVPHSDRTIAVTGLKSGRTALFLQDAEGRNVYSASVSVSPHDVSAPTEGHIVKFYGPKTKDYTSYWCSGTGCGRANPDLRALNGGRDPNAPTALSVTETVPRKGGGTISTTRQYE